MNSPISLRCTLYSMIYSKIQGLWLDSSVHLKEDGNIVFLYDWIIRMSDWPLVLEELNIIN